MSDISNALSSTVPSDIKAFVSSYAYSVTNLFNYGNNLDGSDNVCLNAKLQLNGHDRFQQRDGNYFNYVQPAQHFPNTPADGINVYSFALNAEDHQPSGTCNFSRIDNATLIITTKAGSVAADDYANVKTEDHNVANISTLTNLLVFAENYNVLRVMSGMGGLAYSN
jgi:hypothetical protein